MLPSCGWSQFSLIVGIAPMFSRSMWTASISERWNLASAVMALATSVSKSWGAFAHTGNPTVAGGLGNWPRYKAGERQMMVYFPELKVLYASDLAQPAGSGDWTPTYYDELRAAVERAGLKVDTLFAMHMTPVPWSDILAHIGRQ